jgi:hypothetical protein
MSAERPEQDEYLDVSTNMRTYINMRFAQLTLFIAITATLLNAMFGRDTPMSFGLSTAFKIGGLLSVVIFCVMEERAADFFHHYKNRAQGLEQQLGYKQYTFRPERKLITATNAVRLLFGALFVFWLIALSFPCLLQ